MLPGVYNPARLNEKPLPLLVLVPNNEQQRSEEESNERDPLNASLNSTNFDDSTETHFEENSQSNSSAMNVSAVQSEVSLDSGNIDGTDNDDQNEQQINENDSVEANDAAVLPSCSATDETTTSNMLSNTLNESLAISQPVKSEPFYSQLAEENAQAVEDVLNDSYEKEMNTHIRQKSIF